jgi:ferredoxin
VSIESLSQEIQHLEERCTGCTACVPICPTGALDVDRKSWKVSYDPEKCVVCLSCLEVCIYKAVEVNLAWRSSFHPPLCLLPSREGKSKEARVYPSQGETVSQCHFEPTIHRGREVLILPLKTLLDIPLCV